MNKKTIFAVVALLVFTMSCGGGKEGEDNLEKTLTVKNYIAENDSMMYGLACDGCNDSILVLLPDSGGDPVFYNIIEARRNNKVYGMPSIGDKMAVMVSPDNPLELLMVVNLEQIKGKWYYERLPIVKAFEPMDSDLTEEEKAFLDSVVQLKMVPREYVYTLRRDFTVLSSGGPPRSSSLDRESFIEYPPMKRYSEWHIHNGKIIFSYADRNNHEKEDSIALLNDTAEFVMLRPDTMVLRFAYGVQGFKLKPDTLEESN